MCTTTGRVHRGRFSPSFNWGAFLQFVRDITRDFTLSPAVAAAGTRPYNYVEGGGKLRYWPMRRDGIDRVVGLKRISHTASFGDRIRAVASTTTDRLAAQSLEQIANALDISAKELARIAEASDVNDERDSLHVIAKGLGNADG